MPQHRLSGELWRRALLWGSTTLPQPVKVATMPIWAAIPFALVPEVREQIARNLDRVLGNVPGPLRAVRSYRVLVQFAQSLANTYAAHGGTISTRPELIGDEHLRAARAAGRGVIVATGHVGPWMLGPYLLEKAGHGPVVIAMAREPDPGAQRLEELLRQRFRIVYTDNLFASLELLETLRSGGLVAVQLDRGVSRPGAPFSSASLTQAPFFGQPAAFPVGPAALARAAESPIVPVFLTADGPSRIRVEASPAITAVRTGHRAHDLESTTQALAKQYERCVGQYPFQWYCFQDFWAQAGPPAASASP